MPTENEKEFEALTLSGLVALRDRVTKEIHRRKTAERRSRKEYKAADELSDKMFPGRRVNKF